MWKNYNNNNNNNETYKYLGILEADTIKQQEMKEKIKKDYLRRARKLHETKLQESCQRDKYMGNPHLVWYSGSFLNGLEKNLSKLTKGQEN